MKSFKFDVIIKEEDLCNRERERKRLLALMRRGGRMVLYSIRRMGKTSLATVCSDKLKQENPNVFSLFVDLNEVASLEEAAGRFRSDFEVALRHQVPLQKMKELIQSLVARLKVELPGGAELSLDTLAEKSPDRYLHELFCELQAISSKRPVILIVDEFQGIAGLKDVQALLRREFQQLSRAAIILMGSNQRLLYKMLNDKKAPFFGFGEDMELREIDVKDYLPYLNERFAPRNIVISREAASYLLQQMNNIPNYINEMGAWLIETVSDMELTRGHIDQAVSEATLSKRGRYESALYGYTKNQKKFLQAAAKIGRVVSHTGKEMQELTRLSPTELMRINAALDDCPLLSRDTDNRLFLLDPFLKNFLANKFSKS